MISPYNVPPYTILPHTIFPPYYIWGFKYANCQPPHGSMAISISIYILTPPRGSTSLSAVLVRRNEYEERNAWVSRESFPSPRFQIWTEGLESRLLWPVGFQPWVYGFAIKTRNNGNAGRLGYLGWRILYLDRFRLMRLDIVCTWCSVFWQAMDAIDLAWTCILWAFLAAQTLQDRDTCVEVKGSKDVGK